MTEVEWQAGEHPAGLIEILTLGEGIHASLRKKRLFCLECCRRLAQLRADWPRGRLVEAIARWIDSEDYHDLATGMSINDVDLLIPNPSVSHELTRPTPFDFEDGLLREMCDSAPDIGKVVIRSILHANLNFETEFPHQSNLLRDIFGNPYRPVSFDPDWCTSTVHAIARGMYESRDFSTMPILFDALQDAGCENDDILKHCRGEGPHVRGCWVVDMILGKG